jgi:hypothetical protein
MPNYVFLEMLFKQDIRGKMENPNFIEPFKR